MIGKILGTVVGAMAAGKLAQNGLPCMLGHKWNGCTCERCGAVRDEHHRMVSVPGECTQQCAICGKPGKIVHRYKKDPDTGERICIVCGICKEDEDRKESRNLKIGLGLGLGCLGLLGLMGLWEEHKILAILVIVLIITVVITVLFLWFRHLKRQQDIEILKVNINKIGEDEAAWRAEKYREWRQDK
jgi:hypothetical protein